MFKSKSLPEGSCKDMSEPQCYFGVQLDTQCHKLEFCRTTGTVKLTDLEEDIQEKLVWRAGLLGHEGELTICFRGLKRIAFRFNE